jgi:hypothetical protein
MMMPNSMDNLNVVREVGTGPCACPNPGKENRSFPGANLAAKAAKRTVQENGRAQGPAPTGGVQ